MKQSEILKNKIKKSEDLMTKLEKSIISSHKKIDTFSKQPYSKVSNKITSLTEKIKDDKESLGELHNEVELNNSFLIKQLELEDNSPVIVSCLIRASVGIRFGAEYDFRVIHDITNDMSFDEITEGFTEQNIKNLVGEDEDGINDHEDKTSFAIEECIKIGNCYSLII